MKVNLVRHGILAVVLALPALGQTASPPSITVEQPDAERTKSELTQLLDHYPPSLPGVLALDPTLLSNQAYLAPYPALVSFLNAHPEVARNPAFYINKNLQIPPPDHASQLLDTWRDVLAGLAVVPLGLWGSG